MMRHCGRRTTRCLHTLCTKVKVTQHKLSSRHRGQTVAARRMAPLDIGI